MSNENTSATEAGGAPPSRPRPLGLYRLVPVAEASDPRWDMATYQGEVVVRAHSPADARIVAAEAETDFRDTAALPGDGNTTDMASAFRDDKLYTVIDAEETDRQVASGERGVVSGTITREVIAPMTHGDNDRESG